LKSGCSGSDNADGILETPRSGYFSLCTGLVITTDGTVGLDTVLKASTNCVDLGTSVAL